MDLHIIKDHPLYVPLIEVEDNILVNYYIAGPARHITDNKLNNASESCLKLR